MPLLPSQQELRHGLLGAVAALLLLVPACTSDEPSMSEESAGSMAADSLLAEAISAHGGGIIDTSVVAFTFRGARFRLFHDHGQFRYERIFMDTTGRRVRDVLSNDSLYRSVDGRVVDLSADERAALNTTVNSVAYFALLPYKLSDPAVNARRLGIDTVRGTPYHRVEVTFAREGGGQDWEDRFVYWFDTTDRSMDFLAYAYGLGGEEPGHRFREAYNVREVEGVRVADYLNFTDSTITPSTLESYPDRFGQASLKDVSRVELDSIDVRPTPR
ncbi:DUF6503 family protein [Longibacter sp.]|uniref:DUF6503 family protein n=1 Tax=Longibacter sp. TaxID=2045415 RepID=UPI003EBD50AA